MIGVSTVVSLSIELERLVVEVRAAHAEEERAADAAENADRRRHRFDQREAQLGVQVKNASWPTNDR